MKRNWELEELIEHFTLLPNELELIENKFDETRLGFAALLKFFQFEARFPKHKFEIPRTILAYIAKQLSLDPNLYSKYDWEGRSIKRHRVQIREFFGFREATVQDAEEMTQWLCEHVLYHDQDPKHIETFVNNRFRELQLESPSAERIDRLIRSAIRSHEERFFESIYKRLNPGTLQNLDALIESVNDMKDDEAEFTSDVSDQITFQDLRSDSGRAGVKTIFREFIKLRTIRRPDDLFTDIPEKVIKKYKQRTITEDLRELRRHPAPVRYTLLSAFFWLRSKEITDSLIELLTQIVHQIWVRAEKKVEKEILHDLRRVSNKYGILLNMAQAAVEHPDGLIKEVLYPVVSEQTLKDLIKELKHTGPAYREKIHTVIRSSYSHHYRRMVPEILNILQFRSNNDIHRPVIRALELIKKYAETGLHYFPITEDIPIDGVIRAGYKDIVLEKDDKGQDRINRINYEISALQALRDKLRCKEVWVEGSSRYRNPDEDLPRDFEERREENYKALNQPLDAEAFINRAFCSNISP
ncbi:DUF4158 domain-containing protein [Paenibacillus caui]|uniref:DUF4158 domain-containing protein n=1 Tax=Paenibacillus caui TaxID=2873927 RepID=UPI001CA91046|nr:DUF4158 domain-containing protein [Paenibacillus caui]